jgi:DNA-binding SARP family transcriptional activator
MAAEVSGRLRVEVLGPLRAWWIGPGEPVEIAVGAPRRRAVFAVLALRAGRSVTKDDLIGAVWGNHRPASVEGNVHTYVSGLRRALDTASGGQGGSGLLVSDAGGYAIQLRPAELDVTEFERRCVQADRDVIDGDHRAVVDSLEAALRLWRGDALSGVPGPFAEQARTRLAQLRLTAVERRAGALLALGEHRELCAELSGLVREHPLSESLRELLMLALYRSGRQTEALDVFLDTRRHLRGELGVEPGERLRRLHERMLAVDPALELTDLPPSRPLVVPDVAVSPPDDNDVNDVVVDDEYAPQRDNASVRRVAERLAATATLPAEWMTEWLAEHHATLAERAPHLAADMLERAVNDGAADDPRRDLLLAALAGVLRRVTTEPRTWPTEPPPAGGPAEPLIWRNRFRRLTEAPDMAEPARTARLVAHSLHTMWLICMANADSSRALTYLDEAVAELREHPALAAELLDRLADRAATLLRLDSLEEAARSLTEAAELAQQHELPPPRRVAAACHYWAGRWDETMADAIPDAAGGAAEPPLPHGWAALVAARRDMTEAAAYRAAAERSAVDEGGFDVLPAVRATLAERVGEVAGALAALSAVLDQRRPLDRPAHPWLPWLVRLAQAEGNNEVLAEAVRAAAEEADREVRPGGAAVAVQWCRGLVERESVLVRRAAAHYRTVGRRPELAAALEDCAALLGESGQREQASAALAEAIGIYAELGADADIRRARGRLAGYGVGHEAPEPDAGHGPGGWDDMSARDVQAAAGFAEQLALPRRNIQTHVASLLNKLDDSAEPEHDQFPRRRAEEY